MIDLLSFITSQLGQRQAAAESAADRALREKLSNSQLDLSRDEMTQRNLQFLKEFGLRKDTAGQENQLAKDRLLASLAESFKSPDLLNLIGNKFGVPGLGYRTFMGGDDGVPAGVGASPRLSRSRVDFQSPAVTWPRLDNTLERTLPWRISPFASYANGTGY